MKSARKARKRLRNIEVGIALMPTLHDSLSKEQKRKLQDRDSKAHSRFQRFCVKEPGVPRCLILHDGSIARYHPEEGVRYDSSAGMAAGNVRIAAFRKSVKRGLRNLQRAGAMRKQPKKVHQQVRRLLR